MKQRTSPVVRDKRLGQAALAYAALLLPAAAAVVLNLIWPYDDSDSWLDAANGLDLFALLAEVAGFSVIGVGFLGERRARAVRVRVGALVVAGGYLALFAAAVVFSCSPRIGFGPVGIILFLAHLANALAAVLVAWAYVERPDTASELGNSREWRLGWAALWVASSAALWSLSDLLWEWSYLRSSARAAVELSGDLLLLVAASVAAFGLFQASRRHGSSHPVEDTRRATCLMVAGAILLVAGACRAGECALQMRPWTISSDDPTHGAYAWLQTLSCLRLVFAGLLGSLAFVLSRNRSAPRDQGPRQGTDLVAPVCPSCGAIYDPADYRNEAADWICDSCGHSLRPSSWNIS